MTLSDLINTDMLRTMVLVATLLLLGAFGELLLELSGILNLAIEGTETLAAAATFVIVFKISGNAGIAAGLAGGALAGMAVALLLALFSVTLRANQITVGLALLILGLGAGSFLYRVVVGITTRPTRIRTLAAVPIPLLRHVPVLGTVLFRQNLLVYGTLLIVAPLWWLLFRTPAGLRLRATGENPKAVDSLGLSVQRIRYIAAIAGGALIGLAGAFFPLVLLGGFNQNIIGGRGWLALMLVIFGRWRPLPILLGALLFAYLDALQFQLAARVKAVPTQFLQMLPYVLAILVLVQVYNRARAPAALTLPFDREARL